MFTNQWFTEHPVVATGEGEIETRYGVKNFGDVEF